MTLQEKAFIALRETLDLGHLSFEEVFNSADDIFLREDLGLNETNAISLYFKLKEIWPDLELSREEVEPLQTVSDAFDLLTRKLEQ